MAWKHATCKHCLRPAAIKGRGLCARCWKAVRDDYPLRHFKRPWTAKEVHWLRQHYRALKPAGCAAALGRTVASVVMQAVASGISRRRRRRAEVEGVLRRLHAEGLTDGAIARALGPGWYADRVKYWRHRLGLPANPFREIQQRAGRRQAARVCRDFGVRSLVEVRYEVERIECAKRGWPQARTLREADVLDALERGPGTVRQLVETIYAGGWSAARYQAARQLLGKLRGRKLIVASRVISTAGACMLYSLAPGVSRHEATRERGERR